MGGRETLIWKISYKRILILFSSLLTLFFLEVTIGEFSKTGIISTQFLFFGLASFSILFLLTVKVERKYIFWVQNLLLYVTIISGFLGSAFFSFPLGSIHLFPYRIFLLLLWVIFLGSLLLNKGKIHVSHVKVNFYLYFLFFWLLYAALSSIWSIDKYAAVRNNIFLFMGISTIFFTVYYFHDRFSLKAFHLIWFLIFIVLISVGILEVATGKHLSVSKYATTTNPKLKFLPTTVFYNTNDFATYLTLSLPFALTFMRYRRKYISPFISLVVFLMGLFLLVATLSRANYIAFLVGIAFWFLFLLKKEEKLKVLVAFFLIFSLLFLFFPSKVLAVSEAIITQLKSISDELSGHFLSSLQIRLNLLKNALFFVYGSYGFGVGAGNVQYYMENFRIFETRGVLDLHNWWMEILANYGILLFILYLIFFLSLFLSLYGIYKKLNAAWEKMICEALLVGLVSFPIASMSSSSIISFKPHWLFFAFSLAFLNYQRLKE